MILREMNRIIRLNARIRDGGISTRIWIAVSYFFVWAFAVGFTWLALLLLQSDSIGVVMGVLVAILALCAIVLVGMGLLEMIFFLVHCGKSVAAKVDKKANIGLMVYVVLVCIAAVVVVFILAKWMIG